MWRYYFFTLEFILLGPHHSLKLLTLQCSVTWCLTWDDTREGNTWYSLEKIIILIIACYFEKESFIRWYKVRNIPHAIRFSVWVVFNRNSLKRTAWGTQKFKTIYSGWDGNSRSIEQHIRRYSYRRKDLLLFISNMQWRLYISNKFLHNNNR